jgi:hypothetical protein
VTLRAEVDNEETALTMHKQRSQPQPGVTAWRANIDLNSGSRAVATALSCCGITVSCGLPRRFSRFRLRGWSSLPSITG